MRALVVGESRSDSLLMWFDDWGFGPPIQLPSGTGGGGGLGGLAHARDGSFLVGRHGQGTDGGIVKAYVSGRATRLPGLDPARRRLGVAFTTGGELLCTYYTSRVGGRTGGVARVDEARAEQSVLGGLAKPSGLVVMGQDIFVADQDAGAIIRFRLGDEASAEVVARVPRPDHMCLGPDGSLLVSSRTGEVFWVTTRGSVRVLESGFGDPRGVACDLVRDRVFVVARDGRGGGSSLYVLAL